jgi:hypothetical protein
MRFCQQWMLSCAVVALVAGCGTRSTTVGLQGDVAFEGRAIVTGRIDFVPVDNTPGASVGATITDGRYSFPAEKGLMPDGVYLLRVTAFRKTGRTVPNRIMPGGKPVELQENFIPADYNDQSTLKVRVGELPDKTKADFQIGKSPAMR